MNAVPFDTLSKARKLQASGLDAAVAAGMVEALVEGLNSGELATTADVARTTAAIDGLRIDLRTEIASLHTQLKTDNELLHREIISNSAVPPQKSVASCDGFPGSAGHSKLQSRVNPRLMDRTTADATV